MFSLRRGDTLLISLKRNEHVSLFVSLVQLAAIRTETFFSLDKERIQQRDTQVALIPSQQIFLVVPLAFCGPYPCRILTVLCCFKIEDKGHKLLLFVALISDFKAAFFLFSEKSSIRSKIEWLHMHIGRDTTKIVYIWETMVTRRVTYLLLSAVFSRKNQHIGQSFYPSLCYIYFNLKNTKKVRKKVLSE